MNATSRIPVPPGGTIGILGGGQLGRMLALAAASLGLKAHVYSDAADAPAFDVAAERTCAKYDHSESLAAFARSVDAISSTGHPSKPGKGDRGRQAGRRRAEAPPCPCKRLLELRHFYSRLDLALAAENCALPDSRFRP